MASHVMGKYYASTLTLSDGEIKQLRLTSDGALVVSLSSTTAGTYELAYTATSTNAPSVDSSTALEASTVSKGSAGKLYGFSFRLDSTAPSATYYFQGLNSATLPANGAVTHIFAPIKVVHVSGTDDAINPPQTYPFGGIYASAGIVMCLSSTEFTKTISGAYLSGDVWYK